MEDSTVLALLTTLALSRELNRACKQQRVVTIFTHGDDDYLALPTRVGWFDVTFDAVDADEMTWLATYTIPIVCITSVSSDDVERVRNRLERDLEASDDEEFA